MAAKTDNKKKQNIEEKLGPTQKLPLVLEILPGQAENGYLCLFKPGSYEGKSINQLVSQSLKKNISVEDRSIVSRIEEQLDGGQILYKGKKAAGKALQYATREKTEENEDYLNITLRVVKPQEGGLYRL